MESIVMEDTPLASLLEGEGAYEGDPTQSDRSSTSHDFAFAPPAPSHSRKRIRQSSSRLSLSIPCPSVSKATAVCSKALNLRVGNGHARFQEHFRYIVIASQLLEEYPDHGALQASRGIQRNPGSSDASTQNTVKWSGTGLLLTTGVAFLLVCLFSWMDTKTTGNSRTAIFCSATALISISLAAYVYSHKQSREYRRRVALDAASQLIASLQAFELASSTGLTLIQEVELVSKGYRFSSPLPPVSRLDDAKTFRRCLPLRRQLHRVLNEMLQSLIASHTQLQTCINFDDSIKYLDVYDISREAIQDSIATNMLADADIESLGTLRALAYRVTTIRRALLCDLLSVESRGDVHDKARWEAATDVAQSLAKVTNVHVDNLKSALRELEDFALPNPTKNHRQSTDRVKTQVRKISNLSSGIRSLQAKMTLLREEANSAISTADDLTDLGPALMSQYESIGADLQALMSDWEAGKSTLKSDIIKHERRISLASSDLRSVDSASFHGLSSVDEGGPADALRALIGDREDSRSPRSSMPSTPGDEEVFEALAMPKQRSALSREERIQMMQEERARAEERREARDSGMSMMRELKSVIGVRAKARGRESMEGRKTTI